MYSTKDSIPYFQSLYPVQVLLHIRSVIEAVNGLASLWKNTRPSILCCFIDYILISF